MPVELKLHKECYYCDVSGATNNFAESDPIKALQVFHALRNLLLLPVLGQ